MARRPTRGAAVHYTLGELAQRVAVELRGDPGTVITHMATLQHADAGALAFLANPRYRRYLPGTGASAVILAPDFANDCPVAMLVTPKPYVVYAQLAAAFAIPADPSAGVDPSASVSPSARLGPGVHVGPLAVIGERVSLGEGTYVGPGCIIEPDCEVGPRGRLVANITLCSGTRIGSRVIVHPGVVIGADGFGIANDEGVWIKVPQLGGVVIGDDVEIGANTTIDRGALEDTVIEDGVKLDNQIQIGHNVRIGAHTAVAGCVGISGSAKIGRRCTIGGGTGINGHIEIGDDIHFTGMSRVMNSISQPGVYSSGSPLEPNLSWRKNSARMRQLDDMARRLRKLEKKIEGDE